MIVSVTNRLLCSDSLEDRVRALAEGGIDCILLREKDLREEAYEDLALRCRDICDAFGTKLIVNSRVGVAKRLGINTVQVPFPMLLENEGICRDFPKAGVSVHSVFEARKAQALGAAFLIAGHIFETACKQGLPPRGLSFLNEVCSAVSIPVLAIGGIRPKNLSAVKTAGAAGVCVMSKLMACSEPNARIQEYKAAFSANG